MKLKRILKTKIQQKEKRMKKDLKKLIIIQRNLKKEENDLEGIKEIDEDTLLF